MRDAVTARVLLCLEIGEAMEGYPTKSTVGGTFVVPHRQICCMMAAETIRKAPTPHSDVVWMATVMCMAEHL